jgi:hypothetical protein
MSLVPGKERQFRNGLGLRPDISDCTRNRPFSRPSSHSEPFVQASVQPLGSYDSRSAFTVLRPPLAIAVEISIRGCGFRVDFQDLHGLAFISKSTQQ